MKVTYDTAADAIYMSLVQGDVAKTVQIHDRLLMDVDADGNALGLEILDASSQEQLVESIRSSMTDGVPVTISTSTSVTA